MYRKCSVRKEELRIFPGSCHLLSWADCGMKRFRGENQKLKFEHVTLATPTTYPSGDVGQASGHMNLKLKGEIQIGNINVKVTAGMKKVFEARKLNEISQKDKKSISRTKP